ncbi:MAG TPA: NADH-quinone oxidoreductase subunit L, partial [Chromatiaceae bacterium]|nr:NADH-quinone oxidoreductase subunit L [Chromatiaceae bacterium]
MGDIDMKTIYLALVLAPLAGSVVAGLFRNQVGKAGAHWAAILGVAVSFALSAYVFWQHVMNGAPVFNENLYTWMVVD